MRADPVPRTQKIADLERQWQASRLARGERWLRQIEAAAARRWPGEDVSGLRATLTPSALCGAEPEEVRLLWRQYHLALEDYRDVVADEASHVTAQLIGQLEEGSNPGETSPTELAQARLATAAATINLKRTRLERAADQLSCGETRPELRAALARLSAARLADQVGPALIGKVLQATRPLLAHHEIPKGMATERLSLVGLIEADIGLEGLGAPVAAQISLAAARAALGPAQGAVTRATRAALEKAGELRPILRQPGEVQKVLDQVPAELAWLVAVAAAGEAARNSSFTWPAARLARWSNKAEEQIPELPPIWNAAQRARTKTAAEEYQALSRLNHEPLESGVERRAPAEDWNTWDDDGP